MLRARVLGALLCALLLSSAAVRADAPAGTSIPNLSQVKDQIVEYHDSGAYDADIAHAVGEAQVWLAAHLTTPGKLAIVLDIDETSLSNWPHMRQLDFGYVPELWNNWEHESAGWPIQPTVALYRFAKQHNIAVFFITSRPEKEREFTVRNLESAGYRGWDGLYLRGPDSPHGPSVIPYKSGVRKMLTEKGYHILLTMGDQMSDLDGGYADKGFKLPNPMYFIP